MAKLTGQTIADSYDQLLIVDAASGISGSLQAIEAGDTGGSASSLKISTSKCEIIPASDSTKIFEVSDEDGNHILSVDASNNRVGIGIDSPTSPLHVAGTATDMLSILTTHNNAEMYLGDSKASNKCGVIGYNESNNYMYLLCYGDTAGEGLNIADAGNVGIGTTPVTFHANLTGLQIGGNGILTHETASGASKTFKIAQNVREEITSGDFTYISTDEASFIELNSGKVVVKTSPSGSAGATATMTERFTILQAGNVGIGTVAPASTQGYGHALEIVDGDSGTSKDSALVLGSWNGSSAENKWEIGNNTSGKLEFVHSVAGDGSTGTKMVIQNTGYVGIGATTPAGLLDVEDTSITATASYTGFVNTHTKTAGASSSSHNFKGISSTMTFSDADEEFGNLQGAYIAAVNTTNNTTAGGDGIYGVEILAQQAAGNANNIFGAAVYADVNDGTVDDDVIGLYVSVDVESNDGIGGSVYGQKIEVDSAEDPTSKVYGLYIDGNTNIDYGLIVDGGSVGIGTASPAVKTEIRDAAQAVDLRLTSGHANGYPGFRLYRNADSSTTEIGGLQGGLNDAFSSNGDGLILYNAISGGKIIFRQNSTNKVIIDDNSRTSLSNNDSGGDYNTIFGNTAGGGLTNGGEEHNTFIGHAVAATVTMTATADKNTGVGAWVLNDLTSGHSNVGLGYDSLAKLTSGHSSVGIGASALVTVTTGAYNIAIGVEALDLIVDGAYNVAIGHQALTAESEQANHNTAVGFQALLAANVDGDGNNTCVGSGAGDGITTGIQNSGFGAGTSFDVDANNQTALGYGATTDSANDIAIGNTSVDEVKGQVDFTTFSDERIKTNIQDGDLGLDFIKLLKPRKFNKVNPAKYPDSIRKPNDGMDREGNEFEWTDAQANKVWDGLIAQEVKDAIDECKTSFSGWSEESNSKQLVGYSAIVVPLIKAVQELSAKVEALENK